MEYDNHNPSNSDSIYPSERRTHGDFGRKPRKRRSRRKYSALALIVCMIVSSVCGFLGGYVSSWVNPSSASNTSSERVLYQAVVRTAATGDVTPTGAMTLPEIAAAVKNSVVEITTETAVRSGRMRQFVTTGAGSGVILSSDGYIVTNHHVVADAQTIVVRLSSGQEYPATVKGMDAKTDLAVIKIDATGLIPAVLGDSSTLLIGEGTVAVGNPLGDLGGTVTDGIISALDREITIDNESMSLLQTNAAINPGNSGGGLFNFYGELIGVVNAKSSGSDIEGLGFAIPINTAKKVVEDIIEAGYVTGRVDAGFELIDISTVQMALRYRVNQTGLYIAGAMSRDFQVGDRITAIDGVEIAGISDYNAAMKRYSVGDVAQITVVRNEGMVTVPLQLGELKP